MPRILEKTERRLGEKLFLKGDRCVGPKCAAARRAYPPGIHGKKRSRGGRGSSEFAALLREKQKVHFFYGLDDRDIKRYSEKASAKIGLFSDIFLRMVERRLDMIVWRAGLAESRRGARQMISHGHILVNGKIVRSPACDVRTGDAVSIKDRPGKPVSAETMERIRHYTPPAWISLDKDRRSGTLAAPPDPDQIGMTFDITKIREFYSR
ncbi:MAG: 30S ribosomal protein S4 [Patescibacteria group bacterium]